MENGNSNKRKFKETQRKAKQRASQTPDKIQERRAADLRNKARARAKETNSFFLFYFFLRLMFNSSKRYPQMISIDCLRSFLQEKSHR